MISSTRSSESASRSSWKFASSVISFSSTPSCSVSTSLTRSKTSSRDAAMSPRSGSGGREAGGLYHAVLPLQPLCEPAGNVVLHSPPRQPHGVRDRAARGVPVRDHRNMPEPEEVCAAVGVGIEALPEPPRGRPNEQPAELPSRRGGDLGAQRIQNAGDRP